MQTGYIYLQKGTKDYKIENIMGKTFLAATVNFEDFQNITTGEISKYVLKNNDSTLRKVYSFFQSDNTLLLINGFCGTGKKQVSEHVLSYMDKETIVCRFICTESSKLDDIELSLLKTLKKKTAMKDTTGLDALNSIKDKIDYIVSQLDLKYIFVFYNFDSLKDENKDEILNFMYSYSTNKNIKTLISARVFDTEKIPESQKYVKIMIKALSKEIFESYIRDCGIKVTTSMIEQLYRLTRGYFLYTCLSSKIMINQELTINNFIIMYSNSGMKFDEFLAKTYYKLIVGTTKSAFNLFVKLHHGLNLQTLQKLGSYPEIVLKTLSDNFYIYKKGDLYYATTFLKQQIEPGLKDEISKERLAAYYEKQIELSPEDRDFTISRAALIDEIAFYKNVTIEHTEEKPKEKNEEPPKTAAHIETVLNEDLGLTPQELFDKATERFKSFDYLKALDTLSLLLSKKSEYSELDYTYPAYKMLAEIYEKMAKWKYALYYYEKLKKHCQTVREKDKIDEIDYEIANIHYQSYKTIDAIKELKTLIITTKNSQIIANCNILLGNIALSSSNKDLALKHYKDGIKYIDANTEKSTAIELFFKYAILSDEKNDINNAIEFYQRVIQINDVSSKYTALAFSNLGDLFYDNELYEEAKDCFEKAYNADKTNNNDYGMYYSLIKIVELTDKTEKEKRIASAIEAKGHAKQTGDYHAIIDSTIKLGDLYYDYSDSKKALDEYLELYRVDKDKFSDYNMKMLKSRLNDIKARIGKDKFEELVPDYE